MAINKPKLRELAERIVEQPEQFDMHMWFYGEGGMFHHVAPARNCGTAACLAGHVCLMDELTPIDSGRAADKEGRIYNAPTYAAGQLGLNREQVDMLFSTAGWPHDLSLAYARANRDHDWKAAACVAAERVKRFVESDGKE